VVTFSLADFFILRDEINMLRLLSNGVTNDTLTVIKMGLIPFREIGENRFQNPSISILRG